MQTRITSLRHARTAIRILAACVVAAMMLPTIGACTSPRIAGRAESEHQVSECEIAYRSATAGDERARTAPLLERYLATSSSAQAWQTVAAICPQRLSEGIIRSAQAQWNAQNIAASLSTTYTASTTDGNALRRQRLDGVTSLPLDNTTLRHLALAEDRAGSAMQLLAAKNAPGATLTLSDNHHAAGSQLMTLAGNTGDLRQKEYDVSTLIANPSTATDHNTGLTAASAAIVEMDCTLEELAALSSAGQAPTTGDAATRTQQMLTVIRLVTGHCYQAFANGYPSGDFAVFASTSKQ
ncbi:hypothetical protein HF843_03515 [Bifidobacterium boum]|uniref:Lipoprotein n=1 Tax=Bifidobacterium boum TaxID=78343 RepID=A0A848D2J3_9BIFI|nr:hypothetical protein [Bifidobacterium boum]NMF02254.1 hypothetical protein [Bifidobacterium boum]